MALIVVSVFAFPEYFNFRFSQNCFLVEFRMKYSGISEHVSVYNDTVGALATASDSGKYFDYESS